MLKLNCLHKETVGKPPPLTHFKVGNVPLVPAPTPLTIYNSHPIAVNLTRY